MVQPTQDPNQQTFNDLTIPDVSYTIAVPLTAFGLLTFALDRPLLSILTLVLWIIPIFWRALTLIHSSTPMETRLALALIQAWATPPMVLRPGLVTPCERFEKS